ncbi:MAG: TMEM165/GDT1 family protein [Pseudomonadota bacterium]
MELKLFATVFATVFLAELGDKTQLATVLFASKAGSGLLVVFLAASAALIVSSALGVFAGAVLAERLEPRLLGYVAGTGFVAIGLWTLWQAGSA